MCLIISIVFWALYVWAIMQKDYNAALLYGAIALGFTALLIWNIHKTWKARHKS